MSRTGKRDRSDRSGPKDQDKARTRNSRSNRHQDDERSFKQDKEEWARAKAKRKAARAEEQRKAQEAAARQHLKIRLPSYISNANLAKILNVRFDEFAKKLEKLGFTDLSHDYALSAEDAGLVVMEYGFEPSVEESSQNLVAAPWPQDASALVYRPPVVTIMGHVDHGKTTILDYLRKSSIAAGEHGGITQHIGAFSVALSSGKAITFLDTPGHAAFLSMRQRGANVTDIVVLVVAADDGVMPQTIEAIKHARAANVPMIVAINKVDKPDASIERVKQDIARNDVELEDFGGDVQVVGVSGKTGHGMAALEEAIITLSEILDHRAPLDGPVEGWVLEALTKPHGKVATVLVRRGILAPGTVIVAGRSWGRVRTLRNEFDEVVSEARPGTAVEVDGWRELPGPGDEALQAHDEQHAAAVVRTREGLADSVRLAQDMQVINESRKQARIEAAEAAAIEAAATTTTTTTNNRKGRPADPDRQVEGAFREIKPSGGAQEVLLVIKADVGGSVEAVVNLVTALGNNQVRPRIVRGAPGPVCESDVDLAAAAGARLLTFNVATDDGIRALAARSGVELTEHRVIYRISEDVRTWLEDLLPEKVTHRVTGEADVVMSFSVSTTGKGNNNKEKTLAAGCRVRNGMMTRGSRVKVLRNGETVHDGVMASLRFEKKDVATMKKDSECGIGFGGGWESFEPGDKIQCYSEVRTRAKLEDVSRASSSRSS
jgi:translation initiation factor IF-2